MKSVKLSKKCCVLKLSDKQERSTSPSSSQKSALDYLRICTLDSFIANPSCMDPLAEFTKHLESSGNQDMAQFARQTWQQLEHHAAQGPESYR